MKNNLLTTLNEKYEQSKLYRNGWRRTVAGTLLAGTIGLLGTSGATGVLFGNGETFGQKVVDAAQGITNPTIFWEYKYAYDHREEIQKATKHLETLLPDIEQIALSTEQANQALQATEKGLATFDKTVRYAEEVTRDSQQALTSLKDVGGRVERMGEHLDQARENLANFHPVRATDNLRDLYWEYQNAKEPMRTAYEQTTRAANKVAPDAHAARKTLETTVQSIRQLHTSTARLKTYLEEANSVIERLKKSGEYQAYTRLKDNLSPDELPSTLGIAAFIEALFLYGAWQVKRNALRGGDGPIDKIFKRRALKKWYTYYKNHPEDIAGEKGWEIYQEKKLLDEDPPKKKD